MHIRHLLVLVLIPCLLLDMPNASGWRWVYAVWNFGHVVLFALLTCCVLVWRRKKSSSSPDGAGFYIALVFGMALLGALIEVLQWMIGRDCEWQDIAADTAGAAIVVLFSQEWRSLLMSRWQRIVSVVAGVILLVWAASELILHSVDSIYRRYAMPELFSPAVPWAASARLDLLNITVSPWHDTALSREPLLRVDFLPGEYSTFTLDQVYADWRGYETLIWRWYNPGAMLRFSCRAHDLQHEKNDFDHHDRFEQKFTLAPGWNTLRFPLTVLRKAPMSRPMNLSKMRSTACYADGLQQTHTLYLENVKLDGETNKRL